ncbi:MAG: hypothetical protein HY543_08250 [Deltaproteobacteria bacterium]|nr:hypothetical protein [Deltaproteobacteria bacterium]
MSDISALLPLTDRAALDDLIVQAAGETDLSHAEALGLATELCTFHLCLKEGISIESVAKGIEDYVTLRAARLSPSLEHFLQIRKVCEDREEDLISLARVLHYHVNLRHPEDALSHSLPPSAEKSFSEVALALSTATLLKNFGHEIPDVAGLAVLQSEIEAVLTGDEWIMSDSFGNLVEAYVNLDGDPEVLRNIACDINRWTPERDLARSWYNALQPADSISPLEEMRPVRSRPRDDFLGISTGLGYL